MQELPALPENRGVGAHLSSVLWEKLSCWGSRAEPSAPLEYFKIFINMFKYLSFKHKKELYVVVFALNYMHISNMEKCRRQRDL